MSGRFGPDARVPAAQAYRCFVTRGCNWAEPSPSPLCCATGVEGLHTDLEPSARPEACKDPWDQFSEWIQSGFTWSISEVAQQEGRVSEAVQLQSKCFVLTPGYAL